MMTAEISQATVFKLGRVVFSVKNCQQDFQDMLSVLLPRCAEAEIPTAEEIYDLQTGCTQDVRGLLNHILKRHLGCLWFDAGALIAPNGKKIFIVGQSSAGKSTTTMALALGHGWKVLGEDLVLLDQKIDKIVSFASPFSLKVGTLELLQKTINKVPEPILGGEWSPLGEMAELGDFDLPFDQAFFLERAPDMAPELEILEMSQAEFVRKILRNSNLLRYKDSTEKMVEYLGPRKCLALRSGTVSDRVQAILNAVNN